MSVINLIARVKGICKKHNEYDQKELKVTGYDSFASLYGVFEPNVEDAI